MKDIQLRDATHSALTERMRPKICIINESVGNILKFKDKFYIVTCKHVIDGFFPKKNAYIILKGNSRIYSNEVKYIDSINNEIDIGVIEILNNKLIKDYFENTDIQVIPDFSKYNFKNSFFFLIGFPWQLSIDKGDKLYFHYMSLGTNIATTKNSDEKFIYLEYEVGKERSLVDEKKLKSALPNPKGLSGAFIFKIDRFEGDKNELWSPDKVASIVAIQSAWLKGGNWIKGSNIKYLYQILNKHI